MSNTPERPDRRAGPERRRAQLAAAVVAVTLIAAALLSTPADAVPPDQPKPASVDRGSWDIRALGTGRYRVSWTAPDRFPIRSDRPTITGPARLSIGAPTVAADGRTVRAVVTADAPPDPAQLDVVLSGQQLDRVEGVRRPSGVAAASVDPLPAVRSLATDPGTTGPYSVVSSDYTRTPVKIPGLAEPIEMVGHVVEPAANAPVAQRPLVLFLHGRHDYCYQAKSGSPNDAWPCQGVMKEVPSQLGYDYMQRLLASQGYTTVSVRVNGINAQDFALDDGGAGARATIVQRHLNYWATIAGAHQVDLERVVLVGHSRGGEGVDRASIRIPVSAPYRIVGQVLIAPTDFASQAAPYVPTVTLLSYCDGDVSDLQGQQFTDVGRDLTTDDTSLKSSVLIMGANHNFFNTEWTPGLSAAPSDDDWFGASKATCGSKSAGRLTAKQQRAVGQAYVAGAVRLFAEPQNAGAAVLPLFDGSPVSVASAGPAVVLSHAIMGGGFVRRPALDSTLAPSAGAKSTFCTGRTSDDKQPELCGSQAADLVTPHWDWVDGQAPARKFWQLSWSAAGQSGGLQLTQPLDLRARTLDLRTIVDPRLGSVQFRVRLTDGSGRAATLTPVGGTKVAALPGGDFVSKLWAQTVRVDPVGAGLDLARIVRVEIVGDSPDGRIWLADLSGRTDHVSAPAAKRVPVVSIGQARVEEGDAPGSTTATVPFTLSAPLARPGQIVVITAGEQTGSLERFTIDLPVGQTSGGVPVTYAANTLDDVDETRTSVAAWATSNVMTDSYLGQLVVVDDDPTPTFTLTPVKTTVKEGSSAKWTVKLSAPVNYEVQVSGRVISGPGADVTGRDVPASWLRDHADTGHPTRALHRLNAYVYATLASGSTKATLSIPMRKDGKREGKEAVTVKVTVLGSKSTKTVYVASSR
jgi:hypothetical protein